MKLPVVFIIALGVGAAGFFSGIQYQKTRPVVTGNINTQGVPGRFAVGNGSGQPRILRGTNVAGGRLIGTVDSVDNTSMTVKLQDGSSKVVLLSQSATFTKSAQVTKQDVKPGDTVAVTGTTNSDGSISAQDIQLNPVFRFNPSGAPPQRGTP